MTQPTTPRLSLPAGDFQAYLFDCDGTIADSMPLHLIAWRQALGEWNCTGFDEELFYAWGGLPVAEIIARLNRRAGLKMPVDEVRRRKEALYYEMLPRLQAVPEVLEHIELQYGRIPFAVVSGSTRESVDKSLAVLGLSDKFPLRICAGDYSRSKPDPEPYLLAAQRLGVTAERCLVFEDTELGVRSAQAAGMGWVKVEKK
jgi:HAD superfamily hydrolase (TIGR01509 family)